MILCGRKLWDGSGGNNHATTKYPLAVKLGIITADLEAAGNCTPKPLHFRLCRFRMEILENGVLMISRRSALG